MPCEVPEYEYTIASAHGTVHYGQSVTFTCAEGHYLGGAVSEDTMSFGGACEADGHLDLSTKHPACEPCTCGVPAPVSHAICLIPGPGFYDEEHEEDLLQMHHTSVPGTPVSAQQHARMLAAQRRVNRTKGAKKRHWALAAKSRFGKKTRGHFDPSAYKPHEEEEEDDEWVPLEEGDSLIFGDIALIHCEEGFTVGGVPGGSPFYEVTCGADGDFTEGVPTSGACLAPKYPVGGEVVDAQNGKSKLADAHVAFEDESGETVATATTGPNGHYLVHLPAGNYTAKATKNEWIERVKNVEVLGAIQKGQGADLAMSQVLPPGGYRIVLNWDRHSEDLDSWTYFDKGFKSYVYYGRTQRSGATSGVSVSLDWDDTDGYGPETTTWLGLGHCKEHCLLKFHVDNYSWRDAHLSESNGIVTVYHGNSVLKTYNIPSHIGEDRGWTVFTLDAGDEQIYEGDYNYGPWIKKANGISGSVDWSSSMDEPGWSEVPEGSVLFGISAYSFENLHKVSKAYYYEVQDTEGVKINKEVDWSGLLEDGGWATCPEGSWISGLYRSGSKYLEPQGGHQLVKASCVVFEDVEEWGECKEVTIFQEKGSDAARCPDLADGRATAMVGLQHVGHDQSEKLSGLTHAKCCAIPKKMVKAKKSDLCISSQSCTGIWKK